MEHTFWFISFFHFVCRQCGAGGGDLAWVINLKMIFGYIARFCFLAQTALCCHILLLAVLCWFPPEELWILQETSGPILGMPKWGFLWVERWNVLGMNVIAIAEQTELNPTQWWGKAGLPCGRRIMFGSTAYHISNHLCKKECSLNVTFVSRWHHSTNFHLGRGSSCLSPLYTEKCVQ